MSMKLTIDKMLKKPLIHDHEEVTDNTSNIDSLSSAIDTNTNTLSGSDQWDSAYSTATANSGTWNETFDATYISGEIDTNTNTLSGSDQWDSAYSTVGSNSGTWGSAGGGMAANKLTARNLYGGI